MASIKQIAGIDDYLNLAKEKNICQNEKSTQDCLAEKFHEESLKLCGCIPFGLREFYLKVFFLSAILPGH